MPDAQIAQINGNSLAFYEWGEKGNPVLVCLHSHTNSAASWREFAEFASSKYHVFALDQRGHGNSEWANDGYARVRFVEDLSEFVKINEFETITLVGCSMGGWHSILYTVTNQSVVDRIVMVDIAPEPSPERLQAPPAAPAPMEFQAFEDGYQWLRSGNLLASDERLHEEAESRLKQTDSGTWTWKADLNGFDNPLPDMTSTELIDRYWSAIENIQCPIFEIRGAESGLVSDDTINKMKTLGKDVTYVDVASAGHVVMVDQPEAFIEAVRGFVGL
jgi:pimeloyl-ACP methyl ester carboxylesterase|tara:strand:+ start:1014 stop:1838 length:825 start_codon:yes stop_codon:yes gene_type:complete